MEDEAGESRTGAGRQSMIVVVVLVVNTGSF